MWLDCWARVGVHGDAVRTRSLTDCHATHPKVYRWVLLWLKVLSCSFRTSDLCRSIRITSVSTQGTPLSHQGEFCVPSGSMTPGRAVPTLTPRKAAQCRIWRTWWSPFLQRGHRQKYIHVKINMHICGYVCHLKTHGCLVLDFVSFRACKCCLQERRLTPPTFPQFMELFSVDGGKRIDSSHTIPPSIPLVLPGQSFESKMIKKKHVFKHVVGLNTFYLGVLVVVVRGSDHVKCHVTYVEKLFYKRNKWKCTFKSLTVYVEHDLLLLIFS